MELQTIPVASLRANDYNFNEMSEAQLKGLTAEVKKRGFLMHHITARRIGDDLVIVDGEHQWRAAQAAGLEAVPVQVIEATNAEAIAETYRRNGLRGETNRLKLARAIRQVAAESLDGEGKPLSMAKLGKQFQRSDVWVKTTLQYADLADLAAEREDFPKEDAIAAMTETEVKEWMAYAEGKGTRPGDEGLTLTPGDEEGEGEEKPQLSDQEKKAKAIEGIIKKMAKMTTAERAFIASAMKRMDREDMKAAADKAKANPQLPLGKAAA